MDRLLISPAHHQAAKFRDILLTQEAHGVPPAPHVSESPGDIPGTTKRADHVSNLDAHHGHAKRIDGDIDLFRSAGIEIHLGNTGNPAEPGLHEFLDQVLVNDHVLNRICLTGIDQDRGCARQATVAAIGDKRFTRIQGSRRSLVEPVNDIQQRLAHIHTQLVIQLNLAESAGGRRDDILNARVELQDLFLWLDNGFLDFLGGSRTPVVEYRDLRTLRIRQQLQRQFGDSLKTEHQGQTDQHGHNPLVFQRQAGQRHVIPLTEPAIVLHDGDAPNPNAVNRVGAALKCGL